jgi:hypothetical protein
MAAAASAMAATALAAPPAAAPTTTNAAAATTTNATTARGTITNKYKAACAITDCTSGVEATTYAIIPRCICTGLSANCADRLCA